MIMTSLRVAQGQKNWHVCRFVVNFVFFLQLIASVSNSCFSPIGYYGSNGASHSSGCSDPSPFGGLASNLGFTSRTGPSNWWSTDDPFARFFSSNTALMPLSSSYHPSYYQTPMHMQGASSANYRSGQSPYNSYDPRRSSYMSGGRTHPYYYTNPYQQPAYNTPYSNYYQPQPTSYAQAIYGSRYYPNPSQSATRTYGDPYMDQFMPPLQQYPFPYGRNVVVKEASAFMKGHPSSSLAGVVEFCQLGVSGVRVKGRITGIPGGLGNRGMHILKDKTCPPLDQFPIESAALEHYNPFNSPTHGSRESATKHVGDLGNILVGYDGVAVFDFPTTSQLSLDDPVYSIVNHSIVITEREDDLGQRPNDPESRRNGNSGKAIACGKIELRPTSVPLSNPYNTHNYPWNQPSFPDPYSQSPYTSNYPYGQSAYPNQQMGPMDQMYMTRRTGPYQASNHHPYPYGHVPGYSGYSSGYGSYRGQPGAPVPPYNWRKK